MMRKIKGLLCGLFVLISLFYVFVIVSTHYFKNFYPFGVRVAIVMSGSMEPELKINDFVIVKKFDDVSVGDIVTYRRDGDSVETIHRIVKIDGESVTTKGDSNNVLDEAIDKNQITGVYVGKVKYLGNILSFFKSPIGFSISLTTFVLIMLFPSSNRIFSRE